MRCGLVLSLLFLSACSTAWFGGSDNQQEPAELPEFEALWQPELIWQVNISSGPQQYAQLLPAVQADRIYAATAEGEVQARDLQTGQLIWKTDLGLELSAGPSVLDDLIVVTGLEGMIIALDAEGEEVWRHDLQAEILSRPALETGLVIVHSTDGRIIALDSHTGQEIWLYRHKPPVLTLRGTAAPLIDAGTVYCGLAGGKLVALNLENGGLEWESFVFIPQGRSDIERMVDVDADPVIYDGTLYTGAYQGVVAAIGSASGNLFWQMPLSVYQPAAVNWQQVVFTDESSQVVSLDPDLGDIRWQQDQLSYRQLTAPALMGDYVVVADFEGYVHWLSSDDGHFIARKKLGDAFKVPPLVIDDVLYLYDSSGQLSAVRLPEVD